jgi:hypothetical protein
MGDQVLGRSRKEARYNRSPVVDSMVKLPAWSLEEGVRLWERHWQIGLQIEFIGSIRYWTLKHGQVQLLHISVCVQIR